MAKKVSQGKKNRYGLYKTGNNFAKNKAAKIARHLKQHPDDAIAIAASKKVSATPSRAGHKNKTKRVMSRLEQQLTAQIRSAERVYSFIKDKDTLVLHKNEIFDAQRLKEVFGVRPKKAAEDGTTKTKRPTRRGGKKKAV